MGGCPGFGSDDSTSAAAEEGTEHHEVLDRITKEWWALGPRRGTLEGYLFARRVDLKWPDEVDYLYRFCAQSVDKYLASATGLLQEQRIEIFGLDGALLTWGHFDLLIIIGEVGILVDWKFGQIPVEPADTNRQGFAYAIGCLQEHYRLQKIGVMFVQPRLRWVSRVMFNRTDLPRLLGVVRPIIFNAQKKAALFDDPTSDKEALAEGLNPGSACDYCNRAALCPAYLGKLQVAAPRFGGLPAPADFNLDAIDTPEKAAVAHAWANFLKDKLKEITARCMEIAEANGGQLSVTHPDGTVLKFAVGERAVDRTLGPAPLVAECLAQWVAPEQVLAAADLALGRLEDLVVPAMQEQNEDLTKKAAREILESHLEAHGMLSRPDGRIKYLHRVKEPKSKTKSNTKKLKSNT